MLKNKAPFIFGEVLFDCFPDGRSTLGGAPFNVAWHLQGFGLEPLMLSSIGNDDMGEQVLKSMKDWGMAGDGIQLSSDYPTGQVKVELSHGIPSYKILPDQAYDHLDESLLNNCVKNRSASLIYHGSLALRTRSSTKLFNQMVSVISAPVFLDLNLRDPWWDLAHIIGLMKAARWVKLNDDELLAITETEDLGKNGSTSDRLEALAIAVRQEFELEWLIVTLGEKGAMIVTQNEIFSGQAARVEKIIDTVGAGDAFSSVCILGITENWPVQSLIDQALRFSALICGQRGATSNNRELYSSFTHANSIT